MSMKLSNKRDRDIDNNNSSNNSNKKKIKKNKKKEEIKKDVNNGENDKDDKDDIKIDMDKSILTINDVDPSLSNKKVIIVLENAMIESVKTKRGDYELLNCDDHVHILKKAKRDPQDFRPDITHQCLLALLDSPLNKSGHLQVYIRTYLNVLIEISPQIRIPRTYKRFAGLMVQLLHKLKIHASDGPKTLMRVIKGPVTNHFPVGARIFGTSVTGTLIDANQFVPLLPNEPVVFVFGAIAHGHLEPEYCERMLSVSEYPLSACVAISRVIHSFENKWHII